MRKVYLVSEFDREVSWHVQHDCSSLQITTFALGWVNLKTVVEFTQHTVTVTRSLFGWQFSVERLSVDDINLAYVVALSAGEVKSRVGIDLRMQMLVIFTREVDLRIYLPASHHESWEHLASVTAVLKTQTLYGGLYNLTGRSKLESNLKHFLSNLPLKKVQGVESDDETGHPVQGRT